MSEQFMFAPEIEEQPSPKSSGRIWKIAIIDDEESIHQVTKVALANFMFEGDAITFLHGYSGQEAKEIFRQHTDIALVLLDVIMEDDHSGLDVVRFIREDLGNQNTRIVLRTGQPGQAPEKEIISDYDINDYKEKTELTSRKLYTLIYSCLRAYRDIVALDESRMGLEKVINASKHVFEKQFLDEFAVGVLQQLTSILHIDKDAFFGQIFDGDGAEEGLELKIAAGTGSYQQIQDSYDLAALAQKLKAMVTTDGQAHMSSDQDEYLAIAKGQNGAHNVIFLTGLQQKSELDRHLIDLYCQNVLVAFDNLSLRDQVIETQREIVYLLGEAVESRSKETGNHVKRVAEISKLLALKHGISPHDAEILKNASPMHDLGKVGIADAILNKPGKLDDAEWEHMKSHTLIGYEMLKTSQREILKLGAILSLEHHEKWDGSGYPYGKAGAQITLEARITAIADVFDALASDRCYKKAWPLEKVYEFLREQQGKHFDPELIDLLFENIDQVNQIREKYVDHVISG